MFFFSTSHVTYRNILKVIIRLKRVIIDNVYNGFFILYDNWTTN